MYDHILVRYGELGLKGKNQKDFLRTLKKNIRHQIKLDTGKSLEVHSMQGRITVPLDGEQPETFYPSLDKVFGISSYSPVVTAELNVDAIVSAAIAEVAHYADLHRTFHVNVRRANKQFSLHSSDMAKLCAERISQAHPNLEGDLEHYELDLSVEIRNDAAYLYLLRRPGLGGLPLGTGGRALALLSGGIDSPVAIWSIMRRGAVVEAVHFHSYPYTSKDAEEKVLRLAEEISCYGGHLIVHLVPFTHIQEAIGMNCFDNLRITIMRRFMMRIAEKIAEARNAKALVTGDNLGQVASQTMESIYAINEVTNFPVFRPLIAFDKADIMSIAKKIGTYNTSILPYEDCCTVFVPKEPKTKPKRRECAREEAKIDNIDDLIADAIRNTETIICYSGDRERIRRPFEAEVIENGEKYL